MISIKTIPPSSVLGMGGKLALQTGSDWAAAWPWEHCLHSPRRSGASIALVVHRKLILKWKVTGSQDGRGHIRE